MLPLIPAALGLVRSRKFIYITLAVVAMTVGASLWSYGKGYNAAESSYQKSMNEALVTQYRRVVKAQQHEQTLALEKQRRRYETEKRIAAVGRVDCPLSPECVQWYDDILRAAPDNQ